MVAESTVNYSLQYCSLRTDDSAYELCTMVQELARTLLLLLRIWGCGATVIRLGAENDLSHGD